MSNKTRDTVFEIILAAHIHALTTRRICYRPEFALLSACQQSIRWAYPHRELLRNSLYGLDELKEIWQRVPVERFFNVFFGRQLFIRDYIDAMSYGNDELKWEISHGGFLDADHYDEMSCLDLPNLYCPGLGGDSHLERMHRELGELVGE